MYLPYTELTSGTSGHLTQIVGLKKKSWDTKRVISQVIVPVFQSTLPCTWTQRWELITVPETAWFDLGGACCKCPGSLSHARVWFCAQVLTCLSSPPCCSLSAVRCLHGFQWPSGSLESNLFHFSLNRGDVNITRSVSKMPLGKCPLTLFSLIFNFLFFSPCHVVRMILILETCYFAFPSSHLPL